jgi:hypothetical protein
MDATFGDGCTGLAVFPDGQSLITAVCSSISMFYVVQDWRAGERLLLVDVPADPSSIDGESWLLACSWLQA